MPRDNGEERLDEALPREVKRRKGGRRVTILLVLATAMVAAPRLHANKNDLPMELRPLPYVASVIAVVGWLVFGVLAVYLLLKVASRIRETLEARFSWLGTDRPPPGPWPAQAKLVVGGLAVALVWLVAIQPGLESDQWMFCESASVFGVDGTDDPRNSLEFYEDEERDWRNFRETERGFYRSSDPMEVIAHECFARGVAWGEMQMACDVVGAIDGADDFAVLDLRESQARRVSANDIIIFYPHFLSEWANGPTAHCNEFGTLLPGSPIDAFEASKEDQ